MNEVQSGKPVLNYNVVPMFSGLLRIIDFLILLLAVFLSIADNAPGLGAQGFFSNFVLAALIAAIPGPFFLYDRHFGAIISRGRLRQLLRSHLMRFTFFAGFVVVLGSLSPALNSFPAKAFMIWAVVGAGLTSVARLVMAFATRRYQRRGALTEVIAIVGAGAVADRLVETLRQNHGNTVELLGVFDDKRLNAPRSKIKAVGNIAQLLELGKTRKIDWILLTLPPTADRRILEIVQRLKALSVPIGLCPQHVGLTVPYRIVGYVGDNVPVSLLADRPGKRWDAVFKSTEDYLPRWIITLALLPLMAIEAIAGKFIRPAVVRERKKYG
ncbi:MAG: hypothetical protein GC149_15715 [Gammaproteobacteria bacterium]|nr:hypothetical protein [Gammaproteobacteria bacterium]